MPNGEQQERFVAVSGGRERVGTRGVCLTGIVHHEPQCRSRHMLLILSKTSATPPSNSSLAFAKLPRLHEKSYPVEAWGLKLTPDSTDVSDKRTFCGRGERRKNVTSFDPASTGLLKKCAKHRRNGRKSDVYGLGGVSDVSTAGS